MLEPGTAPSEPDVKDKPIEKIEDEIGKEIIAMPEEPVIEMTRKQLYDEIWKISVAGVAKKYDIPYTQLMKQIKDAAIPIPPSGYWTKLGFGKPVAKIELTESLDAAISLYKSTPRVRTKKTEVALRRSKESKAPNKENELTSLVSPTSVVDSGTKEEDELISTPPIFNEPETYTQYGYTYNVYDRENLYKEVWQAPITEIAKLYKVSDVTIHKVCKSLEIPTPPAGYWAKKRAGKPVTIIPLSKSSKANKKTGIRTGITYQPEAEREILAFLSEEDRSVVLEVASQILLPDEEVRMNSKIIAHRKTVVEWKKRSKNNDYRGWNRRNSEPVPYLAETISDDLLPRACRIIDALIKGMEPLGCSLTNDLSFVINEETVWLSFSESKDEVPHIPTKEENMQLLKYEEDRKRYSYASKPQIRKYDHVFNGRLSLAVVGQKSFRDCKSYVLEERLGNIMIEMYEAAEELKKAREAREEAERKRKEEERKKEEYRDRYNIEVDHTLALANLAEDYNTACRIRNYISAVEASDSIDEEDIKWIEWAKAKADWYDPTIAKEDEFFGEREHEKDAEHKKLKHAGYGWW